MTDAVLIALISSGTAILSGVISGTMASRLTIYRIDQLERKVDKHNCLVERMAKAEIRIESVDGRLSELREEVVK